jgi:hypothetical protein
MVGGAVIVGTLTAMTDGLGKGEKCEQLVKTKWGWKGAKKWRDAVNLVKKGGTLTDILGHVPTKAEALELLKEAGVDVNSPFVRIEEGHFPPNPHTFPHINYPTPSGGRGTIQIVP